MSTSTRTVGRVGAVASPRAAALAGIAALTAGYCSTLYWVTTVEGGTAWLLGGLAVAVGAAVLLCTTAERTVLLGATVAAALTGGWYFTAASPIGGLGATARVVSDTVAMTSGISVRELAAVDVWIAAVAPVPTFVSVYLALRRRYVLATAAGGWLLVMLALTGDALAVETLLGALGAVTAVGFGELDRRDGSLASVDLVVVLLAGMAVLALAVPLVPAGQADPLDPLAGADGDRPGDDGSQPGSSTPLDDQVLSGDAVTPGGPIELSTDVRFVVEAEERRRWRVGALDRYTGEGWVQRGSSRPYGGSLMGPQGPSRTLDQRFDLRAESTAIPAASYPVAVEGPAADVAEVTGTGVLTAGQRLGPGDDYVVRSEVPTPTTEELRSAGTDYPDAIERRNTQLPAELPDRVANLTDQVTAEAETPYETAVAVEAYLEDSHGYSRNVSAPGGDVVDAFLFEMDAGYCTYFAASMATMLRTQDVPARVATGYNGGQWAGEDTWVVRGTDAHAWVEVYFPDVGWVEFDPTPSGDWRDARRDAVDRARENGTADVDVPESEGRDVRFEAPASGDGSDGEGGSGGEPGAGGGTGADGTGDPQSDGTGSARYSGLGQPVTIDSEGTAYVEPDVATGAAAGAGTGEAAGSGGQSGARVLPAVDGRLLAVLLVAGGVAGARRSRAGTRVRQSLRLVWQPRRDPETDVERSVERLDRLLGRRYRPRRASETRREYLLSLGYRVDDRVRRAYELHERARYAGETDRETADELRSLVDDLVGEAVGPVARLGR